MFDMKTAILTTLAFAFAWLPSPGVPSDAAAAHDPTSKSPSPPPAVKRSSEPKATFANVAYGAHPRQVLRFWMAQSDKPTPLVFFIHGGSWMNGDRMEVARRGLAQYLDASISVVSIEYRMISDSRKAGVHPPLQWPLEDAARALQFVRSKAGQWGINKARVAVSGVSAGACSGLWLALHDEMADPSHVDPVAHESTRVVCAGVFDAQTTLDPLPTRAWIPNATYGAHAFGFFSTSKNGKEWPDFAKFYDSRETALPWIKKYSPMEWAGADDPPVCCKHATKARPAGQAQRDPTHAPVFGLKLGEKLAAAGVECHVIYPGAPAGSCAGTIEFIIDKLNATAGTK